jgi:hypothetical protein
MPYFIVQDRWCELCSRPAALRVVRARKDGKLWDVCSTEHGQMLIDQQKRMEKGLKEGTTPKHRNQHSPEKV